MLYKLEHFSIKMNKIRPSQDLVKDYNKKKDVSFHFVLFVSRMRAMISSCIMACKWVLKFHVLHFLCRWAKRLFQWTNISPPKFAALLMLGVTWMVIEAMLLLGRPTNRVLKRVVTQLTYSKLRSYENETNTLQHQLLFCHSHTNSGLLLYNPHTCNVSSK